MSGSFFLDTNIFVYTFDSTAPKKQAIASRLVEEALRSGKGMVSTQVVQEFFNVALSRFKKPLSGDDCQIYLSTVFRPLCRTVTSLSLLGNSLELKEKFRMSFYDSLIISAAIELECKTILSEDFQDGQNFDGTVVQNPFKG